MTKRFSVLCFITVVASCTGHQTFDDGSDAVRQHREDSGAPSPTAEVAGGDAASAANGGATSVVDPDDSGDPGAAGSSETVFDQGPGTSMVTVLTPDVEGTSVTAAVDEELRLTLQTIGGGSYSDAEMVGAAVEYEGFDFPAKQNPGGPTQIFRFRAVAAGTATITIPHSVRQSFVFQIDVE